MRPLRIVSGGQTGVDRAAWDAALAAKLDVGGWVPKGRRAEDGAIPAKYGPLRETGSREYATRTERNVLEADATLILYQEGMSGGTLLTRQLARRHARPLLSLDLAALSTEGAVERGREWLGRISGDVLNVAGPRESADAPVYDLARTVLGRIFSN